MILEMFDLCERMELKLRFQILQLTKMPAWFKKVDLNNFKHLLSSKNHHVQCQSYR
jgi:hypothetical protein